jgi:hypothetical protein
LYLERKKSEKKETEKTRDINEEKIHHKSHLIFIEEKEDSL